MMALPLWHDHLMLFVTSTAETILSHQLVDGSDQMASLHAASYGWFSDPIVRRRWHGWRIISSVCFFSSLSPLSVKYFVISLTSPAFLSHRPGTRYSEAKALFSLVEPTITTYSQRREPISLSPRMRGSGGRRIWGQKYFEGSGSKSRYVYICWIEFPAWRPPQPWST